MMIEDRGELSWEPIHVWSSGGAVPNRVNHDHTTAQKNTAKIRPLHSSEGYITESPHKGIQEQSNKELWSVARRFTSRAGAQVTKNLAPPCEVLRAA